MKRMPWLQRRRVAKAILAVIEDPDVDQVFERLSELGAKDPVVNAFFLKHRIDLARRSFAIPEKTAGKMGLPP